MFQEAASQLGDKSVEPIDLGVLPVDENGKSLNLDFETGTLEDWTADGKAFESQPIKGDRGIDSQVQRGKHAPAKLLDRNI